MTSTVNLDFLKDLVKISTNCKKVKHIYASEPLIVMSTFLSLSIQISSMKDDIRNHLNQIKVTKPNYNSLGKAQGF